MQTENVLYRNASSSDVPAMEHARAPDVDAGPADPRMARYLDGVHHPQKALLPRVGYVATVEESLVGYIAGHQTKRYDCDGELQYLYVVPEYRRSGIGSELLRLLARWFALRGIGRVCVGVDEDNAVARSFFVRYGAEQLDIAFLVWPDIRQV